MEDINLIVGRIEAGETTKIDIDLLNHKIVQLYDLSVKLEAEETAAIEDDLYVEETTEEVEIEEMVEKHEVVEQVEDANEESGAWVDEAPEMPAKAEPETEETIPEIEDIIAEVSEVESSPIKTPLSEIDPELIEAVQEQVQKKALHQSFTRTDQSVNQKMAGSKTGSSLADSLQQGPISDIKTAISLNLKLTLIKELFKGEQKDYKRFIEFLTKCQNYSEAKLFVQDEAEKHSEWNNKTELLDIINNLITRKFRS